jgi:hypothetical protein
MRWMLRTLGCGLVLAAMAAPGCASGASEVHDPGTSSSTGSGGMSTGGMGGGAGGSHVTGTTGGTGGVPGAGGSGAGSGTGGGGGGPCPAGSTLLDDRTSCPGALPPTPAALASAAAAAVRGDIVTLGGLDDDAVPCLPTFVCLPADAPTLLFSDSPESPTASGVLYADTVGAGAYRLYVYHANGGAGLRKFPLVVLNQGAADAHVVIDQAGVPPAPSQDYGGLGKAVAEAWLSSPAGPTVTVPAGQRVLLDPALDALYAANAELVHAIYDVHTDATLKFSVVSLDSGDDTVAVTAGLSLLPPSGGDGRGTFPGADLLLVPASAIPAAGVTRLRLGGDVTDADLTGVDATTGDPTTLTGNFGVLYRMHFAASSDVALALAPRGTDWGGAAEVGPGADVPSDSFVLLPSAQDQLGTTTDAVLLGRFAAGSAPYARLLTGGGSNLPIDLVTAPLP